jgi:hypothetical protein
MRGPRKPLPTPPGVRIFQAEAFQIENDTKEDNVFTSQTTLQRKSTVEEKKDKIKTWLSKATALLGKKKDAKDTVVQIEPVILADMEKLSIYSSNITGSLKSINSEKGSLKSINSENWMNESEDSVGGRRNGVYLPRDDAQRKLLGVMEECLMEMERHK